MPPALEDWAVDINVPSHFLFQSITDNKERGEMEVEREAGRRSRSISRSMSRNSWRMEDVFAMGSTPQSRRMSRAEEDEEALRWAALEKLPTYDRLRTSIIMSYLETSNNNTSSVRNKEEVHKEVDVRKLDMNDRQQFIDRLFKVAEEDNEKFLRKFRNRIDK